LVAATLKELDQILGNGPAHLRRLIEFVYSHLSQRWRLASDEVEAQARRGRPLAAELPEHVAHDRHKIAGRALLGAPPATVVVGHAQAAGEGIEAIGAGTLQRFEIGRIYQSSPKTSPRAIAASHSSRSSRRARKDLALGCVGGSR
jgi:hypothetical protein